MEERIGFIERIKKFINIEEFLLDITIVGGISIITRLIIPGRLEIDALNNFHISIFAGVLITFFVSILIGELYDAYITKYSLSGFLKFLVKFIFFLAATWSYLGPFFFEILFPSISLSKSYNPDMDFFLFLPYIVASISGMIIGFRKPFSNDTIYIFYVPFIILVGFIFIGIISLFISTVNGFLILLLAILPVVIVWILKTLLSSILKKIEEKSKTIKALAWATTTIVLPIIFGVILVLWQYITIKFMVQAYINNNMKVPISAILLSLILGGILPIRLLMNIAPPKRLWNTIIGILSFSYYFLMLYIWIRGMGY